MRQTLPAAAAALAALLLSLAACESPGLGSVEPGEVRFTFSGDTAGSYEARGRSNAINFADSAFAIATEGPRGGRTFLKVESQHAFSPPWRDIVELGVFEPRVRSVTCAEGEAECGFLMAIAFGTTRPDGGDAAGFFRSIGGTVTLTRREGRRARGTFEVDLEETRSESPRRIRATGTFDVYVLGG